MENDKIKCMTCGKIFKDDTKIKIQDSREGNFKNICPFCYSTCTENTHKSTKQKRKFIYEGKSIRRDTDRTKAKKRIKRPDLDTEHIRKEVLGDIEPFNIEEESLSPTRTRPMAEPVKDEDWYRQRRIKTQIAPVKPFTPIELMERKLESQYQELLAPPDNYKRYRGWRYHRRLNK